MYQLRVFSSLAFFVLVLSVWTDLLNDSLNLLVTSTGLFLIQRQNFRITKTFIGHIFFFIICIQQSRSIVTKCYNVLHHSFYPTILHKHSEFYTSYE